MKKYTSQIEHYTEVAKELDATNRRFSARELRSKLGRLQKAANAEDDAAAEDILASLKEWESTRKVAAKQQEKENKAAEIAEYKEEPRPGPRPKSNEKKA